jgi:hypothetical protein
VGSEALSFGSKAAKAALDPESGVERGSLGEGWKGRRAGREFGCVLDLTGK